MFGQHSHHVGEALIDGNVERRAHGVVQEVNICPFAQQQPCDLCLITKVKHDTNRRRHVHRLLFLLSDSTRPKQCFQLNEFKLVNKNSNAYSKNPLGATQSSKLSNKNIILFKHCLVVCLVYHCCRPAVKVIF